MVLDNVTTIRRMSTTPGRWSTMRGGAGLAAPLVLCLIALLGTPASALAVYASTTNGIKHGTTGVDTDGDVWAFMRDVAGDPMKQALVSIGRASDHQVVASAPCYSGCRRIDLHHHPVANECVFHGYFKEVRLLGHWHRAC
jgi:hypothetical protein